MSAKTGSIMLVTMAIIVLVYMNRSGSTDSEITNVLLSFILSMLIYVVRAIKEEK